MAATKLGSIKLTDSVLKGTADLATEVTGTLAVANGGTGQTVYTDGQLLIGNTTGNTLTKATLTAGTGVTITNGGGSITIAASGGGSDPWTYAKLPGSFTNVTPTTNLQSISQGGVTLEFTPAANTDYEFVGVLMLRTSAASSNPRTAIVWPTGLIDGVGAIWQTGAASTTQVYASGSVSATIQIAAGGLPNNSADWPCFIEGTIRAGSSPSGTVSIQMASETSGQTVTVRTGSFLRWRTI